VASMEAREEEKKKKMQRDASGLRREKKRAAEAIEKKRLVGTYWLRVRKDQESQGMKKGRTIYTLSRDVKSASAFGSLGVKKERL